MKLSDSPLAVAVTPAPRFGREARQKAELPPSPLPGFTVRSSRAPAATGAYGAGMRQAPLGGGGRAVSHERTQFKRKSKDLVNTPPPAINKLKPVEKKNGVLGPGPCSAAPCVLSRCGSCERRPVRRRVPGGKPREGPACAGDREGPARPEKHRRRARERSSPGAEGGLRREALGAGAKGPRGCSHLRSRVRAGGARCGVSVSPPGRSPPPAACSAALPGGITLPMGP